MLDIGLLLPPLLAGLIVLATHVPLGKQVLARGIIFIDLAVAQLASLGVILAYQLFHEPGGMAIQLSALAAALVGALGLRRIERHWPEVLEAIIGVVFVLAVTASLLLLANDPHGGERLKDMLAGQLLWVTYDDLLLPALVSAAILLLWFVARAASRPTLFYALFALSVTMSVQLVGVYLVFASLIIPALTTRRQTLFPAYVIGVIGYGAGLLLSLWNDLPTGPLIVWTLAMSGLLIATLPQKVKNA